MDDMIRMKNTKFVAFEMEIDTLKQTLSKHVKEKESLLTTLNGFKTEFKERESKSIDKEIVLEKKNKELENIIYFGKRFILQQELSTEQMFWLQISNKNSEEPSTSNIPVKIEVLSELPKLSLVNKSLKKLRFHLASFDKVVKVRTTPDAITDGSWGFEHTKKVFLTEIIPWLNKLKDFFKEFDKGLHDEITKVQTVFTQMEAVVEQCSVDKKCCEIQQKQFLIENERLLDKIISHEIVNIVLNSSVVMCDSMKKIDEPVDISNKYLELKAEFVKKNDAYIELSKRFSNLKQHCISLEVAMQLNKENFQKEKSCENQNAPAFHELFETNNLKAQLQAKDTIIKALFESSNSRKVSKPNATTIARGMFQLDIERISDRLKNNRDAHKDYLKKTIENTDTIRGLVECARK
ncbi:hypothetical protein Tco_0296588 [Tanacetum coccineum]